MFVWYSLGAAAAILIAWLAAQLHVSGHAPIGIISVSMGVVLGVALSRLGVMLQVAGRRSSLIVGALILALLLVLAQHAWLYADFRRQWHEARANSPEVAMFRPAAPWSTREYFGREMTPGRVALWALDGALITTATIGTIFVLQRHRQ